MPGFGFNFGGSATTSGGGRASGSAATTGGGRASGTPAAPPPPPPPVAPAPLIPFMTTAMATPQATLIPYTGAPTAPQATLIPYVPGTAVPPPDVARRRVLWIAGIVAAVVVGGIVIYVWRR